MRYFYLALTFLFSGSLIASDVDEIKEVVGEANYCEVKNDCVIVGAVCPIGCNIVVNQSEASSIKELLAGFKSNRSFRHIIAP